MKKSYTLVLTLMTLGFFSLSAQEMVVQAFNYDSGTRDSVITFPDDDHNKWEKIIMLYSMRCKDGLVSPPIQGQTNRGCGEWDYSCNTYITDSSQVDSLFRISPNFVISNFSGDVFNFLNEPTYTYYQSTLKEVSYNSTLSEESFSINSGTVQNDAYAGMAGQNKRFQYLLKKGDLENGLMSAGAISGLKLDVLQGQGDFKNLKIRMKHYQSNNNPLCLESANWQEVYYQDVSIDQTNNWFKFFEDFTWDGIQHVILDFSFNIEQSDLLVNGAELSDTRMLSTTDSNVQLIANGSGYLDVNGDFSSISDKISISFWSKGAASLPLNTTFLEGVDENNNRQVNIHLPWSNGRVYWDCGGSGSSYDRIDKAAAESDYKDQWTHWAFTKDAVSGTMRIYKNGTFWHSGTGKTNTMNIKELRIASSNNGNNKYFGNMDDLRIWNSVLSAGEVQDMMCSVYSPSDPQYDNLVLHYTFDQDEAGIVKDSSPNQFDATVEGIVGHLSPFARDLSGSVTSSTEGLSLTCVRGVYQIQLNESMRLDSVENLPHQVDHYIVEGTDLILDETYFYYQSGAMPVYDEQGNIVDEIIISPEGSINIGMLENYSKAPMQMEIMSFVTPYGINLDLGIEGKTWTFDVTDLGPILKGKKRIFLSRGGQWQEDMDIRFLFYEGTPSRNVKSVQQIWPVRSENYQTIQSNAKFEPRVISKSPDDGFVVAKTTITGHGQQGEFNPQIHYINLDNIPFQWSVWKECADNPIYPQGGTWVYDRAGWCPGAASDTRVTDLTLFMEDNMDYDIDYGVLGGSGDSRYIVNSQLVKYGPANFQVDAMIEDIIYPTQKIEHGRFNPNCGKPKVMLKNNGSAELNSVKIVYGIVGGSTRTYEWNGFLDYLETFPVDLDYISSIAASTEEQTFFARVEMPNGQQDEYANNDQMESVYEPVEVLSSEVVINFRTNNNFQETGYTVYDENGDQIFARGPFGLGSNSVYYDTLKNLNGCYKLVITDSGNNGLDWWANPNGGSGYVRVKTLSGVYRTIATDFGSLVHYNFVAGEIISDTKNPISNVNLEVFPNPSNGFVNIIAEGMHDPHKIELLDESGKVCKTISLASGTKQVHESINMDEFAEGLYFIRILDKNGGLTRKLINM